MAGMNFIGYCMEDMLRRCDLLKDRSAEKKQIIQEYFAHQEGYLTRMYIRGTQVRVNAVVRIIKAGQVAFALRQVKGGMDTKSKRICLGTLRRMEQGAFDVLVIPRYTVK